MKRLLHLFLLFVLSLRYRVKVVGKEEILKKGCRGILFMPNHPALIDPVIMMSRLFVPFAPRPLADEEHVDNRLIRPLMKALNAVIIPDLKKRGNSGRGAVLEGVQRIIDGLERGDNILLYPAGRIYRSRYESIGANSSAALIVKRVPDARIVLVRTTGLWGSSFSRANGIPTLNGNMRTFLLAILTAAFFFMPKRELQIELVEPDDFPRTAAKLEVNAYLEAFYNAVEQKNSSVPLFWWQGRTAVQLPEPVVDNGGDDISHVPAATREQVLQKLRELSGVTVINQKDLLSRDLGIDSLVLDEFAAWLEREFAVSLQSVDGLVTVAHCILAAAGDFPGSVVPGSVTVDERWFGSSGSGLLPVPSGQSASAMFLEQVKKNPRKVIVGDQISGCKTYRNLLTGIFALRPGIQALGEDNIGIMLPATVSATLSFFSVIFSGKIPVMVNWTVGQANMKYCLENTGIKHVITARALYDKIIDQGVELDRLGVEFLFLEEIAAAITLPAKIKALLQARFRIAALQKTKIQPTAAILFTSGSESYPKAVPLSHANFLANVTDVVSVLKLRHSDRLLGMLPPFHSLGLAGTVIMPLVTGLPTVYSPNPNEGALLSSVTRSHKVTVFIGTPTFLAGIAGVVKNEKLSSVRIAITGAEKCQPYVYEALEKSFPNVTVCEGYGITECSPVVSINDPAEPVPGSIGRVLDSMEYLLVHPETGEMIGNGEIGKLLLRGPNVFGGYLGHDGNSPFVHCFGKEWYDSGDLVVDNDGVLSFAGRLKRFVKLGGEMISLPAIEELLNKHFPGADEPVLAVCATPGDDHPEIVLFTRLELQCEDVNRLIRDHGFSPLHNIRRIVQLDEIPVLGTGKIDNRALESRLV